MNLDNTFTSDCVTHGCGAVPKSPDVRDHPLERVPAVAEALAAPLPHVVDRGKLIREILNQGSQPSCVAYSTAYVCQGFEVAEASRLVHFDGGRAYLENGGDGVNGIPAERLLKKTKADGFPVLQSALRFKIDSYQWTVDLDTVLAALVAGRLCVIACLLPADFSPVSKGTRNGDVNTSPTHAYHQLCLTGYAFDSMEFGADGWVYGPNSWGTDWGKDGWYRLRMSYLRDKDKQQGLFYGYSLADAPDGDSVPVPTPVPTPKPPARIEGAYLEQRAMVRTNAVAAGLPFIIQGSGFGARQGAAAVLWNSTPLQCDDWADARIVCRAPAIPGRRAQGMLKVRLASGNDVLGPILTVL